MPFLTRTVRPLLISAILVAGLAAAPAPAQAATTSIADPAGDGSDGPRLDITAAKLNNGDRALKVKVDVAQVAKGDLIVFLQQRGRPGLLRAVSEYRPKQGTLNNFLLIGTQHVRHCKGFNAAWSTSDDTITLRIPSRCLRGGDYGAVRFKVLTEIGADADLAPNTPNGGFPWSAWTRRG